MRLLDLFAGIGGFSLAAHWAGWETAAFVEWEKYPQKVLAKNFPGVPIYSDIKEFNYEQEKDRVGPVDIISGGFPCQPFSAAGKRNGTNDDRYLWPEMLRIIQNVRPRWVIGENVAGLLTMDDGAVFEEVCASLENEGYAVESFVLPAISKGAPHRRDRVWIVANSCNSDAGLRQRTLQKQDEREGIQSKQRMGEFSGTDQTHGQDTSHADHNGYSTTEERKGNNQRSNANQTWADVFCQLAGSDSARDYFANTSQTRLQRGEQRGAFEQGTRTPRPVTKCNQSTWTEHWYEVATRLCRMDDGLPSWLVRHRTNRLKALGNSIVPQVAYEIFQAINNLNQ